MVALAPKLNRTVTRSAARRPASLAHVAVLLDRLALALFLVLLFLSPLLYDLVQRAGG